MTLDEYLKGKNAAEFARNIGVDDSTVSYWRSGKRLPSLFNVKKIQKLTNDSVRAEDWTKDV